MTFSKSDSRDSLITWLCDMLPRHSEYLDQSGASYLKEIRKLEGILRPFWGLIPKYSGSKNIADLANEPLFMQFRQLIQNEELPDITTENRQIAVEVGVLGYAIGTLGSDFLALFSSKERQVLLTWLEQLNTIEFPPGNWYFFLVLVNSALKKVEHSYSEEKMQEALTGIESFYLGNGWYSDGKNQQRDYYVSFAFHFYGLLYGRFGETTVAERFKKRALRFAEDFCYWFDGMGRSLPFGRSLTYRFAHVSFWSALVVTGAYQDSSLTLSEIKQMIFAHFRFWQEQPLCLPNKGPLAIGYGYNNLILSEDYNAPASPMWAFKSFVLLELEESDPFWQIEESPIAKKELVNQPAAGFLIQTAKEHSTALSCLQYANNPLLYHGNEKYSKFAYSTYFGFNLTRDNQELEAFAVDSTLAFSLPGTRQYQSRGVIKKGQVHSAYGVSHWQVYDRIQVLTYLIPIGSEGHIRIHEVTTPVLVESVEGGFPLPDWNKKYQEAHLTDSSCLLQNRWGSSYICDLHSAGTPQVIQQGPNSNIYSPEKNGVPVLVRQLAPGRHVLAAYVVASPHEKPGICPTMTIRETQDYFEIVANKTLKIKKERFDVY